MDKTVHIALIGNPNCGKTTLFNELTGSNGYVGNWPGVTVEKLEAPLRRDPSVVLCDLPGVYSLSPYSPEEVVSRDYLLGGEPSCVVDVVDATNLERNLYLATQVRECGVPCVVALNMSDLLEREGDAVDVCALSERLGCPVVSVSALRRTNLDVLVEAAVAAAREGAAPPAPAFLGGAVAAAADECSRVVAPHVADAARLPWYAVKALEGDGEALAPLGLPAASREALAAVRSDLEAELDDDVESLVTCARYDWIEATVDECVCRAPAHLTVSERIDRVVTNRWLGLPVFAAVMVLVYYLAVSTVGTWGTDWANDGVFGDGWFVSPAAAAAFEEASAAGEPVPGEYGLFVPGIPVVVEGWLDAAGASAMVKSLVLDGVVGGVGSVLGFVPQMVVLFLLLCFLEDCGYMSRVAFVMDRAFRRFGLSGKSFIPLLVSSGCGVPGIMATKTIENERDRRMTVMLATMIPCGAKTPIVALLMGVLVGGTEGWWIAPLFYFLGLSAVIVSAVMLKKTKPFAGEPAPFVMELPAYHLPALKPYLLHVWERVSAFIKKAGTVIFVACVGVWFLSNFGVSGWEGGDGAFGFLPAMEGAPENPMDFSLLAAVGAAVAWVFAPLGFGSWQAAACSLSGLVAKENLVSTFGVLFDLGEVGEGSTVAWATFRQMFTTAGTFSLGAMLAFVAFNMLDAPCFAAIGTIRRQMSDTAWFWAAIGYQCGFGWVVGLIVNQLWELFALGRFGVWTVVAFVALAAILFQLARPMPAPTGRARTAPAKEAC